jgi:hypothetical protein
MKGQILMREEILRSLFDTNGFGLEVGPSYNPLLPKAAGYNVETIDHADAPTLRAKYSDRAAKIEDVDYINDGGSILTTIGKPGHYDFIVASHVIEHMPDIIGFLRDCETLLKPSGCLVLAIPDKRYCFDVLRPLSTVGQALQAFEEKRTRHPPSIIYDNAQYGTLKRGKAVWLESNLTDLEFAQDASRAKALFKSSMSSNAYHDAHGWQFTPSHFRFLMKTFAKLGYVKMGEQAFRSNKKGQGPLHEFYTVLSRCAPVLNIPDIDLMKLAEIELREISISG